MKLIAKFFAAVLMAPVLFGCSGDDADATSAIVLRDIVRYEGTAAGTAAFTLQSPEIDADVPVTLQAKVAVPEEYKEGDRLLMSYVPQSGTAYEPGMVKVLGMAQIANLKMTDCEEKELAGWRSEPIYMLSLWRSGDCVNMRALMRYSSKSRRFGLLRPESQAASEWPELYVAHELADDVAAFSREYYISFDISQLADDPAVKGFNINLNNSNLPQRVYSFRLRD